jgi:hypothetical protein
MPLDYPHPAELEQRVGLHYKPFRLLWLTTFFLFQPLTRAILFYLASNPRSRASLVKSFREATSAQLKSRNKNLTRDSIRRVREISGGEPAR